MWTLIFGGSLFLVFFAYFGYPLMLWIVARFRRKEVKKAPFFPLVTLIVTAYNEEKRIREKLENTLELDYPREKLQVLIASDGSTDATDSIVLEYADRGIELLPVRERRGKENAQRQAVLRAQGEILVFSDVATRIDPDGLQQISANFADPTIGCVSSVDRVLGRDGQPGGEGAYVRYEMWLRRLESQVNSLVGLSGSFFAARREVCLDFSPEMQSDFRTLLNSMRMGLRGVLDPGTVGYYLDIADNRREFNRKVRTVLRGLTVFFRNLEFLNPLRFGFFSFQFFCHKLLRWLVPFFLLTSFLANFALSVNSNLYSIVLILHSMFYVIAIYGLIKKNDINLFFKIPTYFIIVNIAIIVAWFDYLRGSRVVMWAPSNR